LGKIVEYTSLGKIKRYDLKNLKIIFLTLFYKMEQANQEFQILKTSAK